MSALFSAEKDFLSLFGVFHLSWIVLGVPAAVFAAFRLRRLSQKQGRRLLLLLWAVMVVSEIWKQLHLLQLNGGRLSCWYLPFQLCSMPLYLCPVAALARPGRLKSAVCTFLCGYSLLGGLLTLAFPEDILSRTAALAWHGMAWHILLIFLGCWLGFSGQGADGTARQRLCGAAAVYLFCASVALTLNFLLWEPSGHNVNFFYLGPMPSGQPVFWRIAEKYGWLVNLPCYLAAEIAGGSLLALPFLQNQHNRSSCHA